MNTTVFVNNLDFVGAKLIAPKSIHEALSGNKKGLDMEAAINNLSKRSFT
jgi:hypothetical protein